MAKKKHTEQLDFEGQRPGEELLFVFRRHIIAMRKGFYLLLIPLFKSAIPPLIWQDNLELFLLPAWVGALFLSLDDVVFHGVRYHESAASAGNAERLFWKGRCRAAAVKNTEHKL